MDSLCVGTDVGHEAIGHRVKPGLDQLERSGTVCRFRKDGDNQCTVRGRPIMINRERIHNVWGSNFVRQRTAYK